MIEKNPPKFTMGQNGAFPSLIHIEGPWARRCFTVHSVLWTYSICSKEPYRSLSGLHAGITGVYHQAWQWHYSLTGRNAKIKIEGARK
jgi:hypothetical protein